ncbi:hypothetical protein JIN78_00800 [Roseibacillus ishigakijimensis]|uniref:Uncharacterized protein n=2 Tax=Roseibacillus ishigakijimensis TaxID=454146 RepID=A0A934RJ39_9BACT|nr:hypothetical protein [Roseibacillus ishigakijimensis]MBK1832582.1 hypothetical protein [Roseibacillus ishigakijimensis]
MASVFIWLRRGPRNYRTSYELIVACGSKSQEGLRVASSHSAGHVILVHPKGKPVVVEGVESRVTLFLPFVDTDGAGKTWRREGRKQGWEVKVNAGVGQDVRLIWPQVLKNLVR